MRGGDHSTAITAVKWRAFSASQFDKARYVD
jgi:hypothetical protein